MKCEGKGLRWLLVLVFSLFALPLHADEVRVMVSGGFTAPYKILVAEWEKATGYTVTTVYGASMGETATAIPNRLARGEPADIVILAREALDRLVEAGRVVAAASGVYISTEMFKAMGIADQVAGKSKMIPGTPVGEVVARGDADLGFQQISELLPVSGITLVGPIPPPVQRVTVFAAGITVTSGAQAAARQLVAYLSSKAAASTIRRSGLDPIN